MSDTMWLDPLEDYPDWQDGGKTVEAETDEGRAVTGILEMEESSIEFGGNDTFIRSADGSVTSLMNCSRYRFL